MSTTATIVQRNVGKLHEEKSSQQLVSLREDLMSIG
jgi:hypothetical protein